jgi:8-oxo-dGTP diphosphatase
VASKTIEAAGGIVVRKGGRALIAVVQRAKDDAWVLPRGKLKRDENPVAGARREVVEETGHRVAVHEYVGAITYRAGGRPKVVQFWRMEADKDPSHELMRDIVAVEWLPLKAAIRRLSYPLEKLFLRHAAARAVAKHKRRAAKRKAKRNTKAGAKHRAVGKPVPKKSGAVAQLSRKPKLKPLKNKSGSNAKGKRAKGKSKSGKAKGAKGKKKGARPKAVSRHKATPRRATPAAVRRKPSRSTIAPPTSGTNMVPAPRKELPAAPANAPVPATTAAHDMTPERNVTAENVSPVPDRAATATPGEAKTIFQRMLGRLAG